MQINEEEVENTWGDADHPSHIYYNDSGTLKKLETSEELWEKTQQKLDNPTLSEITTFLKLSDKTTETEVNNSDTM